MNNAVLVAPIVAPLLMATLAIIVRQASFQRVFSFIGLGIALAAALSTFVRVASDGEILVSRLGGWPAPIAITLVADRLSAVLVLIALVVSTVVLVFAIGQRAADERSSFYHPVYLVMVAGISQAFLAGDLFNLFVAFEVLLMASYVLLTLEGTNAQVRSGTTYVVLNVVESMVLLMAIGLVFAATGTVNMAELPERLAALPDATATGLHLLLLTAFGIKAAVFPLFFWLPDAYPTAPSSVTAVFAGLLTKVGVYAIIRTQTLLFAGEFSDLLVVIGGLTMLVGVLGAISHSDMKRILSFHIVSQIGYMVFGLGLGGPAAIAATVFYLIHHIPVKTSLFLVEGIIEKDSGTSASSKIGGLARRSPMLALLFLIPALSLAGLPPFSGFLAKFALIRAGLEDGRYVIVGVAILVSLLTLVSMIKIWVGSFWGEIEPPSQVGIVGVLRHQRVMGLSTGFLVAITVGIALAAGPLYEYCLRASNQLLDIAQYVTAVRSS